MDGSGVFRKGLRFATLGLAWAALVVGPVGCVHLERFSGDATDFNIQVADAQNKTMLLNIVRAAYRFPMHFTELSTLSGTGTMTEGGALAIPVGVLHGGSATGSIGPSFSITRTPTFNVAVLETQEFYRGMLKPLSLEQVAVYLNEGLPPELLFTLAFGDMTYQASPTGEAIRIENNSRAVEAEQAGACPSTMLPKADGKPTTSEYACFQQVLRALLKRHLTLEQVSSRTNMGPLLTQDSLSDPTWLHGFDAATYSVVTVDVDACTETDTKALADSCPEGMMGLTADQKARLARHELLYRVQADNSEFRFCFDEALGTVLPDPPATNDLSSRILKATIPSSLLCRNRLSKRFKDPADKPGKLAAGVALFDRGTATADGGAFTLRFAPRSTEGIIYYLGEIARCNVVARPPPLCLRPQIEGLGRYAGEEQVIFSLAKSDATEPTRDEWDGGHIAVNWGGHRYAVDVDPEAKDRSGQVLRVLAQLLALNRSAKDFPSPATVPILSH